MDKLRRMVGVLAITVSCGSATAQIVVGQTAGLTGPVGATVHEAVQGARLYIDNVNMKGGIKGERIELVTLDDKFDVKAAVENARSLVEEHRAVALFMTRGTPHTEAILPLLEKHKVPLIAPSTGAMILHRPVNQYVFNVRSSYQREAEKAVEHLHTIGIFRIAVVHVDDSFGRDALEGAKRGFEKSHLQPVSVQMADRNQPDFASLVPRIVAADAQAVIWIGTGASVVGGVKALRSAGSAAQVVTLSNNASTGFIKLLGAASHGVIVTQVFPYERSYKYGFVQEAMGQARAKGIAEVSPAMLEGFAAAKVLVEALRRASPRPTREKLLVALESMDRYDLGGLEVGYSVTDHTGLDFADLSIIGGDGKFKR